LGFSCTNSARHWVKSERHGTGISDATRNWNLVWRVSGSELLALWQGRKPRSPSPHPLPKGEGDTKPDSRKSSTRKFVARSAWLPLLWGEGWGEGERGRRTDAAVQKVFGPRETVPQFLAAWDRNVRAPTPLGIHAPLAGNLTIAVLRRDAGEGFPLCTA